MSGETGAVYQLQLDNLEVDFATKRGNLRAVDGVSLDLVAGQTLGIVGESGSGKSVLCKAIMGILPATATVSEASSILFDGHDLRKLARKEAQDFWGAEIAMVFQNPMTSLTPVLKVGRQIVEPLRAHLGLSKSAARDRALQVMRDVGIPEPERRFSEYPHELSGGLRQRVMIAIALSCEPKLLIADEPTTALDVTVQQQILNLLQRVGRERGMSIILVSHDLGVVAGRTDRVYVMYGGKVMEQAPTSSLASEMWHPYSRALMNSRPRLSAASGGELRAISGRPPDLVNPPPGCRFAPRCGYVQEKCRKAMPAVAEVSASDHAAACFFPVKVPLGHAVPAMNGAGGDVREAK